MGLPAPSASHVIQMQGQSPLVATRPYKIPLPVNAMQVHSSLLLCALAQFMYNILFCQGSTDLV